MTGIVADLRRHAPTYVVLIALGLFYAASLAIFVRSDRKAAGVSRANAHSLVPIVLSEPLRIGYFGCGECRRSGWAAPQADWTWTIKDTATLMFSPPAAPGLDARALVFAIDAAAFLPRDARRTLRVSIGGEVLGEVRFLAADPANRAFFSGEHFVHSFRVPARLLTARPAVEIELHMASVGSPRMYDWSTDRHELGVAVRSVAFGPAE
jgi:hypothetical protein